MRVTENTNYGVVRDSISRSKGRMETLQEQSATLKKINTPSDDPVGATKVLEIRTDKVNSDQFQMNSKMALSSLSNTDQALSELSDIVVRAKEIAIGQASGASANDDTRLGVSEEVSQLFMQAVTTGNRRIGDKYIFGGYKTNKPPVTADGQYVGDDGQAMVEISKDVFLASNIPGIDVFNTNPKNSADKRAVYEGRAPASTIAFKGGSEPKDESVDRNLENVNVFDELQNLRIALLTGNTDGIRNTLDRFDEIHGKLVANRAKVGSRMQALETASSALDRHNLTNAQLSSNLEDADMAQVVSDLAKEETVFRSSLASSHKLIQPTLLDFLK